MDSKKYYSLEEFEKIIKYNNKNGVINSDLVNSRIDIHSTCFIQVSIFNDHSRGTIQKDIEKTEKIIKNPVYVSPFDITRVEDGAMGCMLGMAIGDAMGHRLQFFPCVYNTITLTDMGQGPSHSFKLCPGQWTDDTSMGLCLADSLLSNQGKFDPHDLMHRFIAWWKGGYNNGFKYNFFPRNSVGLSGNMSQALNRYILMREAKTKIGNPNSSGNGSLKRNASVPLCFYSNIEIACEIARQQSYTTHLGIEASECCALITHIIINLLKGRNLHQTLDLLGKTFKSNIKSVMSLAKSEQEGNTIDRNWNWKLRDFKFSQTRYKADPGMIGSYSMDAMSMALHILYWTKSFSEAIIKGANLRGNSDSVASIIGQIAGAYYGIKGIPKELIDVIYQWDHGEIALRGYMLVNLLSGKSSVI